MNDDNWHSLSTDDVFKRLDSEETGLTEGEVKGRLEEYGKNVIEERGGRSPLEILLEQFKNMLIIILIVAAAFSLYIGEFVDGSLIIAIVLLNGIFGFVQDYKAEKAIEDLRKLSSPKSTVMRNGKEVEIKSENLVPGDILLLEEGDSISADARILWGNNLKVDESSLTGESEGVSKGIEKLPEETILAERKNMLFRGTSVLRGRGKAIVVGTGMSSELGKIAEDIGSIKDEKTPFQLKMDALGRRIGIAIVFISVFVAAIGIFMGGASPMEMILIAIALGVAAIPEGLPAVITLSLAIGARRMVERNALIRKLPVAEGLGSVNVICTDKTGTLTENTMTVKQLMINGKFIDVSGVGYSMKGEFTENNKKVKSDDIIPVLRAGILCNNARIGYDEDGEEKFLGDPTEVAIMISGSKAGLDKKGLEGEYKRVDEIPFSSQRKMMTTIHEYEGKKIAFVKGAPEVVLDSCSRVYENGVVKDLTDGMREEMLKGNEKLAKNALRVIAMAYREGPFGDNAEESLIFLGLQGMMDPPRKEVKQAIEDCKTAGIRVIMITGDNVMTAKAVADEIGIGARSMEGKDMDEISEKELREKVEEVDIFARVSPRHKYTILQALRENGHVVAMTGDGVNDAPAIKASDVGISMGIRGTDVAKQTSDIILLDDNFATIRNAIEEGRRIFDNVRKFVNYLLSCNLAEVLIVFIASLPFILGKPLIVLTAVQLLWINLLTDGLPALALGVDPAEPDILKRKPRSRDEGVINRDTAYSIIFMGVAISIIALLLFYEANPLENLVKAQTIAFTCLVVFELVRVQIIRNKEKLTILSNKYLLLALAISLLLQLMVLYTPAAEYFRVVPLGVSEWARILAGLVAFYILSLIFGAVVKEGK